MSCQRPSKVEDGESRRNRTKEMAMRKGLGPILLALNTEAGVMIQGMRKASRSWNECKEIDSLLEPPGGTAALSAPCF